MDKFFADLFMSIDKKTATPGSLIIFDEVQFCPKARQTIKHLVADGRYYYIETGSLISIKENVTDILIPSEEESIEMLPMNFEEFLTAIDLQYNNNGIIRNQNRYLEIDLSYSMDNISPCFELSIYDINDLLSNDDDKEY